MTPTTTIRSKELKDVEKLLKKLKDNFNIFACNYLKIVDKAGEQRNFLMNDIQLKFYDYFKKRQKNQIVILKARQFGISTLIEGLIFHNTLFNYDKRGVIIAHKTTASEHIFDMTKYFYNNLPYLLKDYLFQLDKSNAKEIIFKNTNSKIKVYTAGGKMEMRGNTTNYIHASEVAFWDVKPQELISAFNQTVDLNNKDNYIIYESTANGNNHFREMYEKGLDKTSDFQSLFYGWQEHKEYRRELTEEDKDRYMTAEEQALKEIYKLTAEQVNWMHYKIQNDFFMRPEMFKQEYPLCWQEAFLNSEQEYPLIPINYIQKAANNINKELSPNMPIVVGVDTARTTDRTVICVRQGRSVLDIKVLPQQTTATNIQGYLIYNIIKKYNPFKIFIDYAFGCDIADALQQQGYKSIEAIHFNETSQIDSEKYINMRASMFDKMREWFLKEDISIPNNAELVNELSILPDMKLTASGRLQMDAKENIKELNNGKSTDYSDSLALTFARPINESINVENYLIKKRRKI